MKKRLRMRKKLKVMLQAKMQIKVQLKPGARRADCPGLLPLHGRQRQGLDARRVREELCG